MSVSIRVPLADPDLQMGVGGPFQKNIFSALRASFWSRNNGGGGGAGGSGPGEFIDVYQATWPSGQSALDLLSGGCQ